MAGNVKFVVTGDTADAERAAIKLEKRIESLEQKLTKLGETSKKTAKTSTDAFSSSGVDKYTQGIANAGAKLAGMAAIASAVKQAFHGMTQEVKTFNRDVDTFWEKQRGLDLKLQIQGGFTPQEVATQFPQMKKALWATPSAPVGEAVELQTQLAGAGFKPDDIKSGAALKTMLDLKAVTNSFGEGVGDPKEAVLGMSQLIKGLGNVDPNAGDVRRIGSKVASLMAQSDIQFNDLGQLSGEAATLKQFGMTESEQLGAFSWMRDVKGAEEGATGLRIFTSRTATAGTDKGRTEALKKIGLTPEDVAIAKGGVKFGEAIQKIQGGMANLSEEEKNKFLVEMYGEKGQASASIMLDAVGSKKITERIALAENGQADFTKRLETFQGSREAMTLRTKNETDFLLREEAMKGMTWGELRQVEKNAKTGLIGGQDNASSRRAAGLTGFIGSTVMGAAEGLGYSPQDLGAPDAAGLLEIQKQQLEQAKKTNELLDEAARKQPPLNRNGQGEAR